MLKTEKKKLTLGRGCKANELWNELKSEGF
jgi:hypothetical protein